MSVAPSSAADGRLRGALALLALGVAASSGNELSYDALKRRLRGAAARDPVDALAALVLGCSYLFFLAERDQNPRCGTFMDAALFIASSLAVGYDDEIAQTEPGKAIAAFVRTFGPALAASALRPPAAEPDETAELGRAALGRLDAILEALRPSP